METKSIFNGKEGTIKKTHRKESMAGFDKELFAFYIEDDKVKPVVTARIYWGTGFNTCTACIWVSGNGEWYTQGSASAGGYGYHKPSSALSSAIREAGIDYEYFGGYGDGAMKDAVINIAKAIHPDKTIFFHQAHG